MRSCRIPIKRKLHVYHLPNLDGKMQAMCAATSQKGAVRIMGSTLTNFHNLGGRRLVGDKVDYLAISHPGVLFVKRIGSDGGWQQMPGGRTYLTRTDEVGSGLYDSIAWAFEVHLKKRDATIYDYAMLYGGDDSPARIDFWCTEPRYDQKPDFTWWAEEEES